MNSIELSTLIDELTQAAHAYYQELEESPMSDEDFDSKIEYLATLVDEFPDQFASGTPGHFLLEGDVSLGTKTNADETVEHVVPMLSLGKAKTEEELQAWTKKVRAAGAKDFKLQAKLDGFAIAAQYENGKLVELSTRGDGLVGEDTSYLFLSHEIELVGMPLNDVAIGTVEVRGELFLSDCQFEALDSARVDATGSERFKNSRNGLVGTVKKTKGGLGYHCSMTFAAYALYENGALSNVDKLEALGFVTSDTITREQAPDVKLTGFVDDEELFKAVRDFGVARESFTIPTDGVVIKPTDEAMLQAKMGSGSHHPVSQIAFKYPGAMATTVVNSIDFTVGKTGKVTPIARIEPVDLSGVTLSNISLHNFNWIYERDLRVGSTVTVTRANDVIPQVATVISSPLDSDPIEVPTDCPICGSELKGLKEEEGIWPPKTLQCQNLACPSRDFFALKTAVMRDYLDIDGMSEVSLTYLNDIGRINTIADFYTLTLEELADSELGKSAQGNSRRLGEKRAQNILDHIEKSKKLPLYKLLSALSIQGLGQRASKSLIARFKTIDAIMAATVDEVAAIDGFGEVRAKLYVEGLAYRRSLIETMRAHGVEFAAAVAAPSAIDLSDLSFAISGAVPPGFANRNSWVEYVESNGGKFDSGPKATTSFMVGDPNESSSKVKKAISLGTEFISPEEFTSRFVPAS